MREINKIVIHCSDSTWGSRDDIDKWHKERGWDMIGYHYVICNGRDKVTVNGKTKVLYDRHEDGLIETGRKLSVKGAHVKGHNANSIGICLIGKQHFSMKQLHSLSKLVNRLMEKFNLSLPDIYGHFELDSGKTCPNINNSDLIDIIKTFKGD